MMKRGRPPVASGTLDLDWQQRYGDRAWNKLLAQAQDLAHDVKSVLLLTGPDLRRKSTGKSSAF